MKREHTWIIRYCCSVCSVVSAVVCIVVCVVGRVEVVGKYSKKKSGK